MKKYMGTETLTVIELARIASRGLVIQGDFEPWEIREAMELVSRDNSYLTSPVLTGAVPACNKVDQLRLVAALGLVTPEIGNEPEEELPVVRVFDPKRGDAAVAMSQEDITGWLASPAAKELMAFADARKAFAMAQVQFDQTRVKLHLGEVLGIGVSVRRLASNLRPAENLDELMEVARLYIGAARSINPGFCSGGFDLEYGWNNLPYLLREWEETGQLYRVFCPFDASDAAPEVVAAKGVALMRSILEAPDEPEYPLTPEVQQLLDFASRKE
ncbi:MAG: hypothetical protein NTY30_01680 [Candidatus Berkelbacteria bacterium]|nr:hypothetical protein [Candidatus Berkelbacteria bacterium]